MGQLDGHNPHFDEAILSLQCGLAVMDAQDPENTANLLHKAVITRDIGTTMLKRTLYHAQEGAFTGPAELGKAFDAAQTTLQEALFFGTNTYFGALKDSYDMDQGRGAAVQRSIIQGEQALTMGALLRLRTARQLIAPNSGRLGIEDDSSFNTKAFEYAVAAPDQTAATSLAMYLARNQRIYGKTYSEIAPTLRLAAASLARSLLPGRTGYRESLDIILQVGRQLRTPELATEAALHWSTV